MSTPIKNPQAPPKQAQSFAIPALPIHVQNPIPASLVLPAVTPNQGVMPVAIPVMAAHTQVPVQPQQTFSPVQYQPPNGASLTSAAPKRVLVQPKNPFPAALMPYLADKVASLNSGNLTWVVESLYQDLRTHGVRKIAIEAKVREDCEKCPQRKVWVVKNDVLVSFFSFLAILFSLTDPCYFRRHLESRLRRRRHNGLFDFWPSFYINSSIFTPVHSCLFIANVLYVALE